MSDYDDYTVNADAIKHRLGYDLGWDTHQLDEEIEEWCIENIGYHPVIDDDYCAYFDKKEDAVSFKLKWC